MSHNPAEKFGQDLYKGRVSLDKEKDSDQTQIKNHADGEADTPPGDCFTHKSPSVLVHGRSSFQSITESLSDELRGRKVREPLTEVHSFVVCSKLGKFNPVGGKVIQVMQATIFVDERQKRITDSDKILVGQTKESEKKCKNKFSI